MANRILTDGELENANALLAEIRDKLEKLATGDRNLLFAYRRKVMKELSYDERGKPMARRALKNQKWGLQNGLCAECGKEMPVSYSELDRRNAVDGYTVENTELVHADCHRKRQAEKGYR